MPVGLGDPDPPLGIERDPAGLLEPVEDPRARPPGGIEDLDRPVVRVRHPDPLAVPGHSQGMLETRRGEFPRRVSEIEESGPDQGGDPPEGGVEEADRRGFGVGQNQPPPVACESRRLGEGGKGRRTILDVLAAAPHPAGHGGTPWIVAPELVASGHGDPDLAAEDGEIPRRRESRLSRRPGGGSRTEARVPPSHPGPSQGLDPVRLEIDGPEEVVSAIGHIEHVTTADETLGVTEGGQRGRTVFRPRDPAADETHRPPPAILKDETVMTAVGHGEELRVDVDLARESEESRLRRGLRRIVGGPAHEPRGVRRESVVEKPRDRGALTLAGRHVPDVPLGIDENQGGPGPHAVAPPEIEGRIEGDEMADPQTGDGVESLAGIGLFRKLGAQDPDHAQDVPVPLLEPGEFRKHVETVDAAVGPEVEEHETAAERGKGAGRSRPNPDEPRGKLGSAHHPVGHGLTSRRGWRHRSSAKDEGGGYAPGWDAGEAARREEHRGRRTRPHGSSPPPPAVAHRNQRQRT